MVDKEQTSYRLLGITLCKKQFRGTQTSAPRFGNPGLPLGVVLKRCGNDPSAGSPTETLLRLHLPLNDEV